MNSWRRLKNGCVATGVAFPLSALIAEHLFVFYNLVLGTVSYYTLLKGIRYLYMSFL